jgi:hypothetical protein
VNYEDMARDFVERTLRNLQAARGLAHSGEVPFEVTFLINSLLGLIVVPHEQMQDRLPTRTFRELQADGWELTVVSGTEPGPSDLRALIRGMRHAVAHFRLEVAAHAATKEIESVTLWKTNRSGTVQFWGVRFTLSELHAFVERLAMQLLASRRPPASIT